MIMLLKHKDLLFFLLIVSVFFPLTIYSQVHDSTQIFINKIHNIGMLNYQDSSLHYLKATELTDSTSANKFLPGLKNNRKFEPKTPEYNDSIDIASSIHNKLFPNSGNNIKEKKDTLLKQAKTKKNEVKKQLTIRKKDFTLHGLISNQFDYGIVPYYISNNSSPQNIFKSQGDVKFSAKKLPFVLSYFYSNPASQFGLQNYYTLRFDAEAYQQNIQNECVAKKAVYQEKLNNAQKLKQECAQKLAYCEAMQNYTNTSVTKPNMGLYSDSAAIQKSIPNTLNAVPDTSITNYKPGMSKADSVKYRENAYADSLLSTFNADTNYQKIKAYKESIEMYDKQIREYEQAVKFMDSNQIDAPENPYLTKAKNFLSNVKKFEIGLCYPNYSTFLINNLTLKGINVGYETSNYFVNASYGKTISNLLNQSTGNNTIVNSFQNYSNFFDFSKNEDGRKILAGKVGLGNASKSYLAFGALYGVGNKSYYQSTNSIEKNIVYEVDSRIAYKGYIVSASFAKSFLKPGGSNENPDVFSKTRNNGLQIRFSGAIPYVKTKFSLGYRIVDPFFKSYGVGFIRTDNIRYEAKLEQVVSSKLKFGANYRRDEDNILKRYGFKSSLNFLSFTTKVKLLRKRVDIQLIYTPILQKIENLNTHFITQNKSDMKNVVIAYTPKLKRLTTTLTGVYSQYTLYDSVGLRNMENMNLNALIIFKNSLKFGLSSGYFDSNVRDSSATPKTILTSIETGFTFKKNINTSLTLKHSYNLSSKTEQYGAACNVNFPIKQYFTIDLHAEKIIIGDFYNSLNLGNVERFPYYCYVKLNLKF
jgi:hypothetical protein